MTVGVDRAAVETALLGGELGCPVLECAGPLARGVGLVVSSCVARRVRLGCGRVGLGVGNAGGLRCYCR